MHIASTKGAPKNSKELKYDTIYYHVKKKQKSNIVLVVCV